MTGDERAQIPVVDIVPMRRRHLRGVLRVEAHNEHRPWSLGMFMSELRREDGRTYLVARVGNDVIGFAGMLHADPDVHITTIAVHPDHRRHAIGTRLMLELCRRARTLGFEALTLEVRASNGAAQALYRRFGLAPVGYRKNYYEDLREDAVVMWAHDIQGDAYAERLDAIEAAVAALAVAHGTDR